MQQDTSGSTSRRTFLKYGLITTGTVLGPSSAGAASSEARVDDSKTDANQSLERGVMRSYQHVPNSQITIDDVVNWQPAGLEGTYRSYAISYDHAPSYRALLFAAAGRDGAGSDSGSEHDGDERAEIERTNDALEPGDALSIGSIRGSPSGAYSTYVTVGLEGVDGGLSATDE